MDIRTLPIYTLQIGGLQAMRYNCSIFKVRTNYTWRFQVVSHQPSYIQLSTLFEFNVCFYFYIKRIVKHGKAVDKMR